MVSFRKKIVNQQGQHLIPQRKKYKPMRFVGLGAVIAAAIIYFLYRLIVK